MLEDELLKWKFRQGRQEALARIYEKYFDSMLTLAMGLLRNAEDAQDVVHDVFVSFARSVDNFRLRGSLSGYLATSVVNRVRDRLRYQRRRDTRPEAEPEPRRQSSEPVEALIRSEEAQRISDALATIPYEQREAVVLRLKANMTFGDIARLQESPVSTVQRRYYNGLARLRSKLNDEVRP
jgi:RNA polymerase sigma-70 factor (ECF subfamily)